MVTKSQLKLGRADHGVKLTREEFADAIYEEPWRYERVVGRLSVMAPSGQDHVDGTEPFLEQFILYKASHPDRVAQVVPEAWIKIDDLTDRIADIGVYLRISRGKLRIPERTPDLVVETASEGYTSLKRDYEEKRDDYYRAGIREYAVVDTFEHRVTVFRRGRGRYNETVLGSKDIYTAPLLPGLKIPLADII